MAENNLGKTPNKNRESLYKRAKNAGKKILYTGAIVTALAWVPSCSSNNWNAKDKTSPNVEQNDKIEHGNLEVVAITREVKENPDGTYSLYNRHGRNEKLSGDYVKIYETKYSELFIWKKVIDGKDKYCLLNASWLEISNYYDSIDADLIYHESKSERLSKDVMAKGPWEYSFTATIDGKKVLIENWKEMSWHYDEIKSVEFGGIVGKIWHKEYHECWGIVTWPVDDVVDAYHLGSWAWEFVVFARNNWQNEFYYTWQPILKLPLSSLTNNECISLLRSFHYVDWKLCYTYPDGWWSMIVLWEKKIKSKYQHVDNVQNYDW